MRRRLSGAAVLLSGLAACPCHLVVTLPLVFSLLAGTAVGAWLASHQSLIFALASVYFAIALSLGSWLWFSSTAQRPYIWQSLNNEGTCCPSQNVPIAPSHQDRAEAMQ
jgi:hypothetical protein